MSFPNKFGLPLVPGVNVFFDLAAERMWVVYTIEQFASLDASHGTFSHPEMQLPGEALVGKSQPMQELTGAAALMMSDICMEVYQRTQGAALALQAVTSVASLCLRAHDRSLYAGVIIGTHNHTPWFAVIFSQADLGEVIKRYPRKDWQQFELGKYYNGLPQASEDTLFVLDGEAAMAAIMGAMWRGLLR